MRLPERHMRKWSNFLSFKRGFRRDQKGSTVVEFALVIVPFIGCLFAIIEVGLFFFASQVLETSVGDAARQILTGQAQAAIQGKSPADQVKWFQSQICTNSMKALFTCDNILFQVQPVDNWNVTTNQSGQSVGTNANDVLNTSVINPTDLTLNVTQSSFNPGTQCQIVVVRVMYQWPTFVRTFGLNMENLDGHNRLLMSTAVFRNEPYSGSGFC
jgi:Flp pilus assembly protein TadG